MNDSTPTSQPVILCILDGWGCQTGREDDAITAATTPNWDELVASQPHCRLETSGAAVGLPEGQMGNSEVGHMTIGSGRIILQDLPRIDQAVAQNDIPQMPAFKRLVAALHQSGGTCHLLGLVSPGGVHSHQNHMVALAKALDAQGVPVAIHAFLDGRDTPPSSAKEYLAEFESALAGCAQVAIATVSGRYYAMDRDKRWDRVVKAYDAMVSGQGERFASAQGAIQASYDAGVTDEFVLPAVIGDYVGMADGDGLLIANFRADRVREIGEALRNPAFDGFARTTLPTFAVAVGMVEYSERHNAWYETLFAPEQPSHTLGEVVSDMGLGQLRIAETEKYAHVTFFFNGGREAEFDGEERELVPSPDVATYDLQPEMSAPEVTDKLVAAIQSGKYSLIVVNYANGDMVGHTGNQQAAEAAVMAVDFCLGRLRAAAEETGAILCVTADHGNAEMMRDPKSGQPHTAHTTFPVPFVVAGSRQPLTLEDGGLSDIAPTVLHLMGLDIPSEMSGKVLTHVTRVAV